MASQGKSRFVPNPMFEQELAHSTMLVDDLVDAAEDIKASAEAAAPVAEGDYRDAFTVESGADSDGVKAQLQNHDWKAVFIEYGTAEHEFNAPIRRGIEAAGYKLSDRE